MIRHNIVFTVLKNGQFRILLDGLRLRLWSTSKWYGFEWDLSVALESRPPRIQMRVRKLRKGDIPFLLNLADTRDRKEIKDRLIRLLMVSAKIPTCYVAVTSDGVPCHMQWMIRSDANNRVQRFTHCGLPAIKDDEVILENSYTLGAYRRQGVEMETARHLLHLAQKKGMKRAILFVSERNLISLKLVSKLGFTPFCTKIARRRFFMSHFTFEPIKMEAFENQIPIQLYPIGSSGVKPDK